MKLYLLQGVSSIQGTGDTNTIGLFCSKPTLKNLQTIFNRYKPTDKKLLNILDGRYSTIGDYDYTLEIFELDNKEILTNMEEEIKVLLCNNSDGGATIVCAITGDITENKIPRDDLNSIKKSYSTCDFIDEDEAVEALLSGEERIITDNDDLYEWDIINTKNIK